MQIHNQHPTMPSDARWHALVEQLGTKVPELADRFMKVLDERALYFEKEVSRDELKRTAFDHYTLILARLVGDELDNPTVTHRLGIKRARQGVPLNTVLEAVRLDFGVLWQYILEITDQDDAPALVTYVEWIFNVIDQNLREVQYGYLQEQATLQQDARVLTERLFVRLFEAPALAPHLVQEISSALSLDANSHFELLVFARDLDEPTLYEVMRDQGTQYSFSHVYRGNLFIFRVKQPRRTDWKARYGSIPSVYVSNIFGLTRLVKQVKAISEIHDRYPHVAKFMDLTELWPMVSATRVEDMIPGITDWHFAAFQQQPGEEQQRLSDTVMAYLDTGSIKETSTRMFCHRNTVINRLKSFHTLTQLDITVPKDAALAYVLISGLHSTGSAQS